VEATSLGLWLGLFTRPAALGIRAVMLGAIGTVHFQHGLFVNWSGKQLGEGFEYHLLVLAMVLT
jgi:putative oxidoreductase